MPTSDEPTSDYDYREFWRTLPHPSSIPPATGQSPEHLRQESALLRALRAHKLVPRLSTVPYDQPQPCIFEVGCGYGRLAALFARHFPLAAYSAIDLNPDCVKATSDIVPDAANAGRIQVADILTYDTEALYDDPSFNGYDLVVASEVLMHIPPDLVSDAFDKLITLTADTGKLITIDWVPEPGELQRLRRTKAGIAPWNFPHDYQRLFKASTEVLGAHRTDRQVIYVIRP